MHVCMHIVLTLIFLLLIGFTTFEEACCGIGGRYHFTPELNKSCGAPGVPVCSNPLEHVFWDPGHFTHHANKVLSDYLIKEMLPQLNCVETATDHNST